MRDMTAARIFSIVYQPIGGASDPGDRFVRLASTPRACARTTASKAIARPARARCASSTCCRRAG